MKKKLYGYAILFHETTDEPGKAVVIKSKILIPSQEILATNTKEAYALASMTVPPEYRDKMEFVEIVVWNVVSAQLVG